MSRSTADFPVRQGWTLRRATDHDLDQIAALEKAIFVNDAWSRETWRLELRNRYTWYLVVVKEDEPGTVFGYAGLLSLPGSSDADVQTIAVAPEARGVGMGRELMRQLHEEAARRGVVDVFLDVRVDNERAQALYRSFGYTDIGVRKGYYQPDDVDAIVMRVSLGAIAPRSRETRGAGHAGDGADRPGSGPVGPAGPVGSEAVE